MAKQIFKGEWEGPMHALNGAFGYGVVFIWADAEGIHNAYKHVDGFYKRMPKDLWQVIHRKGADGVTDPNLLRRMGDSFTVGVIADALYTAADANEKKVEEREQ